MENDDARSGQDAIRREGANREMRSRARMVAWEGGETQERSFAAQADAFAGSERGGKGVGLFRSG